MDSKEAVKTALEYLMKVSPGADQFSNFRLEELTLDENKKDYLVTLSYDIAGQFGFDKKKEYKDFSVLEDGTVESMKIRKI